MEDNQDNQEQVNQSFSLKNINLMKKQKMLCGSHVFKLLFLL